MKMQSLHRRGHPMICMCRLDSQLRGLGHSQSMLGAFTAWAAHMAAGAQHAEGD